MVIEACLGALSKMAPGVTAVVVDNASQDRTVERVGPDIRTIANRENRGFAAREVKTVAFGRFDVPNSYCC